MTKLNTKIESVKVDFPEDIFGQKREISHLLSPLHSRPKGI